MANRSEKKDSIRTQIISAAQVYGTQLAGRDFLYVFGDRYFQLRFKVECFMHLTGVTSNLDSKRFYCYRRDCLDRHLKNAECGIRFIDTDYRELFKIPDGGKVRVTYYDGKVREAVCRFVDDYHLEFGSNRNLYHISELSEIMEKSGNKVEPIDIMPIL